eukprot:scaffold1973_cov399-Prasinococcus_capsulatus_cf.AAC.2
MASAQTALASQLAPTYLSQARRSRYPSLIYEEPDASDISLATVQQNALEVRTHRDIGGCFGATHYWCFAGLGRALHARP